MKPRRHVFMFQSRFAPGVLDGSKTSTIRGNRKRKVREGDILDLRQWSGAPYRYKQIKLREEICTHVEEIELFFNGILYQPFCEVADEEKIARDDGFSSFAEMAAWFEKTHGLPFMGNLYKWEGKSA